ncbi:hypothetical protein SAMN05216196_11522 [Lutimaribacter pacificus]|uniref:site-specific DNA-methyltransferase (adenine-specific) n=1 Tax=Lutimaribacter pacificus TaxID=391948 RepID=A0A1H0P1I8_9RHOB|nr:type IIL restriction-modification enzyme MmeI [Lutimaribacter pacificus]SDO98598.1 hypothetical protein SAMN05216196_11522 [Lutimaribacter pacificus]SHK97816.1 hypothetical protein SAMN05444142_11522 [Lutimaribacter pacificus]
MSEMSLHGEWLSLMDISGPFLAEPVLKDAFPQGLEEVDPAKRKLLRQAYEEWRDAVEFGEDDLHALHAAWIDLLLRQGLELDEDGDGDILKSGDELPDDLTYQLAEHSVSLRPDYAVVDDQSADKSLMLISVYAPGTDLNEPLKGDGWAASPAERMVELCRAKETRLGLLTNGEHWMLVDAPVGAVTTFASWYARLWSPEPKTLQSFINLLGVRRFFVGSDEQLPALLDASLKLQDEVTDALGEQVSRAVEVLIQSLDRADVDRNRELLKGIEPTALYEAGLTVMMRIVFLLSAEERGLLLLGDDRYEANYAVSTLRMQLRAESEEILERRFDAWARLLAIFRAVYGGIDHEEMRLPALGGSLFDPNRFPFLEGRPKDSDWRTDHAVPLPIDNRTVLLLLDAVQLFQGRTLSYRALDVEQIGYVYEGLLERTVVRAKDVTLDLNATKSAKKPWVTLEELEAAKAKSDDAVAKLLKERTGSSASRVKNDLGKAMEAVDADKLLTACHADVNLRDRIKPYFHFLRIDRWGYPLVYPVGTFMVTTGTDRRETGTHYTPKSLTEAIVKETLEPVAYVGPSEGKNREDWTLKSPEELLDLKICDPAMGSGAFLVQVCRWLADRLVEAWRDAEGAGKAVTAEGEVVERQDGHELLRNDPEERLLTARRLIAERCLYGVDINPLAVELAKLSIWLITLAKGRPFGFLDHNLRSGDSLLGIHDIDQLLYLDMNPGKATSKKLFAAEIDKAVEAAVTLRAELRSRPIIDILDVEAMQELDGLARRKLEMPELVADALVGRALASGGKTVDTTSLSIDAGRALAGDTAATDLLRQRAVADLSLDVPADVATRKPFHWPLEFPEVFRSGNSGFDAVVGNPPYLGGRKIRQIFGAAYLQYLTQTLVRNASANADICAFFVRRLESVSADACVIGLVTSSSIAEGDTRQVALAGIESRNFTIIRANNKSKWPGAASVTISPIWIRKGSWQGASYLNGKSVQAINSYLLEGEDDAAIYSLSENSKLIFQGSIIVGDGFQVSDDEARHLISKDSKNKDVVWPYMIGQELNTDPHQKASKWIISFFDWPLNRSESPSGYSGPVAFDYPDCLAIAKERVFPERLEKSKQKSYAKIMDKWWQYWRPRRELYERIEDSEWSLAIATGAVKHVAFGRVVGKNIFSHSVAIIPVSDFALAGLLSSSVHEIWARKHGSHNLLLLRYTPTTIIETLPFPNLGEDLRTVGKTFVELRETVMLDKGIGLTKLYNKIHDPIDQEHETLQLRKSLVNLDRTVLAAYGWSDIKLDHDFRDDPTILEDNKVRFSISDNSRSELIGRLSRLNQERHLSEKAQAKSKRRGGRSNTQTCQTKDLFSAKGTKK